MNPLSKIYNFALDILFPSICISCKNHVSADDNGPICPECLSGVRIRRVPAINSDLVAVFSICDYNDSVVKELVHAFKYDKILSIEKTFGKLIENFFDGIAIEKIVDANNALVVPVPLHAQKHRKRGFNQSEIIASLVSKQTRIPLNAGVIRRIKNTKPQMSLRNEKEREENIKGAFASQIEDHEILKDKDIILVDDVYTSGNTTREAAKVLRKLGAKQILIFVIART